MELGLSRAFTSFCETFAHFVSPGPDFCSICSDSDIAGVWLDLTASKWLNVSESRVSIKQRGDQDM